MGFFASNSVPSVKPTSFELMHRLECKICPLNKLTDNYHPHMPPSGADDPLVYILGEAPGAAEDKDGENQFIGDSGQLLRARIPKAWLPRIRWNNVVRTRPPKNRTPEPIEIECCRPSVEKDIVKTKPKAIFGFGNIPLHWAVDTNLGVTEWRGRRLPVNIGGHECWYYPMLHPAFLYRKKEGKNTKPSYIGSEDERAFVFDIQRALAEIEGLPHAEVHTKETADYGIEILEGKPSDLGRLKKLLAWAGRCDIAGVDYETNCLRPYQEGAKILTAGVGTDELSFAFPMHHRQSRWTKSELTEVLNLWVEFLESECRKAVHFLNFEMEWTAVKFAKRLLRCSRWESTESQAAVLDERTGGEKKKRKGGPLSLDFLVQQHFGFKLKALSNLDRAKLDKEPLPQVLWYNAGDAKYHCLLFLAQQERIQQGELQKQYKEMRRRVPTCVLSQIKGIPVDQKEVTILSDKYELGAKEATAQIMELPEVHKFKSHYKEEFNPASNQHCVLMFRDLMRRREGRKEDGGYGVDEAVLSKIKHPLAGLILKLRKIEKRMSTYVYSNVYPDGLLHTTLNTVFAETKRLTSQDPNLQNIPKRDTEAKEVRRQIRAPSGHVICSADYGQIQARGIAMTSKDKNFVKALWERFDVHGYWAERIAKAYPARVDNVTNFKDEAGKKVLKAFRTDIKNQWTFPIFFGAQLEGVAEYLQIPVYELKPEYREFQKMFSGVFDWQERLMTFYKQNGYVEDLFGFRRHAPLTRNQILNSPIQSLETVFVMDGMSRLSELADETDDWYYQPNTQIHDDLTFILPADNIDKYAEPIVTEMLAAPFDFLNVPLTIEVSIGPNLLNMEEVLVASSDTWKTKSKRR